MPSKGLADFWWQIRRWHQVIIKPWKVIGREKRGLGGGALRTPTKLSEPQPKKKVSTPPGGRILPIHGDDKRRLAQTGEGR